MKTWQLESPPPVEHRLFGLDRRLILPTLGVYAVVFFWSVIMPAIDDSVDKSVVEPGTYYDIGPAGFTPTPGWVLIQTPSPVGESTEAAVFEGGITFRVKGGKWNEDSAALLERIARLQKEYVVEGPTYQVKTDEGVTGTARRVNGPDYTGLLVALVDDIGQGVEVMVKGPVDAADRYAEPVAEMIRSVTFEKKEQEKPAEAGNQPGEAKE